MTGIFLFGSAAVVGFYLDSWKFEWNSLYLKDVLFFPGVMMSIRREESIGLSKSFTGIILVNSLSWFTISDCIFEAKAGCNVYNFRGWSATQRPLVDQIMRTRCKVDFFFGAWSSFGFLSVKFFLQSVIFCFVWRLISTPGDEDFREDGRLAVLFASVLGLAQSQYDFYDG